MYKINKKLACFATWCILNSICTHRFFQWKTREQRVHYYKISLEGGNEICDKILLLFILECDFTLLLTESKKMEDISLLLLEYILIWKKESIASP